MVYKKRYRSSSRRRRVKRRMPYGGGRSSSRRISTRSRSVRFTMRRSGRKPLNNRNKGRASTRSLANRAFVTRGRVNVVEYARDRDLPYEREQLMETSTPQSLRYSTTVRWNTLSDNTIITPTRVSQDNCRFVELCNGQDGNPLRPSAVFNAYTGVQDYGISSDVNYFRVLRHVVYLKLQILPFNLRATTAGSGGTPFPNLSRPCRTDLPQKLLCRLVGVRVTTDDDPGGFASSLTGFQPVYLPAYQDTDITSGTADTSFVSNPERNLLDPESTLASQGEYDYINARFPDFNDHNNRKRTQGVKIVYDQKFTLAYPFEYSPPPETTNGSTLVNINRTRDSSWMRRIKIEFPPHVVKLLGLLNPFTTQYYRSMQYRFFLCVRQVGLSPRLSNQQHVQQPVTLAVDAKCKTWYHVPAIGTA